MNLLAFCGLLAAGLGVLASFVLPGWLIALLVGLACWCCGYTSAELDEIKRQARMRQ